MAAKDLYEKDFYKILGVNKGDSAEVIKRRYRVLARQLHPDKNKGDKKLEDQFKAVSEAYDILSDEKKRAEYDEARSLFERGASVHRKAEPMAVRTSAVISLISLVGIIARYFRQSLRWSPRSTQRPRSADRIHNFFP